MGVDLGELAGRRALPMETLSGRIIAVDSFNMLYQFLASIRQEDGTPLMDFKGNVTAHLSGLFYRCSRLLMNGVRPVMVFDGPPHRFKAKEQERRREVKREAMAKWKAALEEGRPEDARKYAMATSRLTSAMVDEAKLLLEGMGIPCVQAPSEGEAQAAMMVRNGLAYAAASQDYDALLFGAPVLVRNLSITGRRKVPRQDRFVVVEPEEILLSETLAALGITREQLVVLGILVGTDFNEGVPRVGPKTALKIVKEVKGLEGAEKRVKEKYDYDFEVDVHEIHEFFMNPPCQQVEGKLRWGDLKPDMVKELLVERHDFSAERVEKTLNDLEESLREKGAQRKLDQFF